MKKYGIMGGTFDPIHLGHMMIAEYIRDDLELDQIIYIPTGNPPHKQGYIDAEHRYNMVKLAIDENKNFSLSNIETAHKGYSYSVETIAKLKEDLDGKFYFIIGSDSLFQVRYWKNIEILSSLVEFACALRPGFEKSDKIESELEFLDKNYKTKIHIIKTPLYEISSTEIRKRILEGRTLKYVVPDKVIEYIKNNNLYER